MRLKRRDLQACLLILATLFLGACATTTAGTGATTLESDREKPRIVVMPPDVKYYLVSMGGIPEPHAEWTEAARTNFATALRDYADSIGADVTILDQSNLGEKEIAYEELHSAVGYTILNSHFGTFKLPAKNGQFDWSLGPGVADLADQHDADYALFVFYRDYQASGGRVAFAVLATALGAGTYAGHEAGFASLVDLETGDIVWFNNVVGGSGELRDPSGAVATVEQLFKDVPSSANVGAE